MSISFAILTIIFIVVSVAMILIILVQRAQGGGLAGAFGGAGGAGAETVFGGRVGDALTWATVAAFVLYLGLAIGLNLTNSTPPPAPPAAVTPAGTIGDPDPSLDQPAGTTPTTPAPVGGGGTFDPGDGGGAPE